LNGEIVIDLRVKFITTFEISSIHNPPNLFVERAHT